LQFGRSIFQRIYGTGLAAGGYDLNPVVAVTNGVVITGLTYVSDEQVNVNYSAINATVGGGSTPVTVTTSVAESAAQYIPVGDLTPVILGISQSNFVEGQTATNVVISGHHFGTTACPTLTFPFSVELTGETCSDTSIGFVGFTPTETGSGYVSLQSMGYGGQSFEGNGDPPKADSPAQVNSQPPPAETVYSILPALGMAGYNQKVSIAGANIGTAPPKITATGGVTVSNIATPTGTNGSGVTATLNIPTSAGGQITVTVTPTTGTTTSATVNFYVQIPTTLVGAGYPGTLGLPATGIGPVTPVTNVAVTETFSNFSGYGSNPPPLTKSIDLVNAPYADLLDTMALFLVYPSSFKPGQNQSFNQTFTLTYGGKIFNLSRSNTISMGNFNGVLQDNFTITKP